MAQLAPPPIFQFFKPGGVLPLAGGLLYTYEAGTNTPLATFTDSTGGTPNTNPIVLDANGECVVWMGSAAYKFVLTDALGVVQWTRDGIQFIPDGSINTVMLADLSVTRPKIALLAVGAPQIDIGAVGTLQMADDSVTPNKIPDDSIPPSKLEATTPVLFVETSGPRFGGNVTAFPRKPWAAPTLLGVPSSPAVGDGFCVAWSPNGKILAVAENATDYCAIFSRFGTELVQMSPGFYIKPSAAANSVSWSPDTQYLLILAGGSSLIYQRGKNSFSKCTSNITLTGNRNAGAWNPNGNYFAIASDQTPFVGISKRSDMVRNHIVAEYNSTNAAAYTSGALQVVNYENKSVDNMSAVTTGSGTWSFQAQRANTYRIEARSTVAGTLPTSTTGTISVFVNGSKVAELENIITVGSSGIASTLAIGGSFTIELDAFQTIQIKLIANFTGTFTADATQNYISITEDGGFDILSSFASLSNPSALPTGIGKAIAWSPDGMFLAVGHDSIVGYTFTVTSAHANAGTTYTDSLSNTWTVLTAISGSTTLVCTGPGTPPTSGTLTKTGLGSGDTTIAFSAAVVLPIRYLTIYERTGDTLAKCTDPLVLPPGVVNGLSWSPDGLKLTCVHATTPFITSYSRSSPSDVVFVKIPANPNVLPGGIGNGCAYNSAGDKLAVAHDAGDFLTIYSVAGSVFTKDPAPSALPAGNGKSVSWTGDCQYLTCGFVGSPYFYTYQTSGAYGEGVIFVGEVDLV